MWCVLLALALVAQAYLVVPGKFVICHNAYCSELPRDRCKSIYAYAKTLPYNEFYDYDLARSYYADDLLEYEFWCICRRGFFYNPYFNVPASQMSCHLHTGELDYNFIGDDYDSKCSIDSGGVDTRMYDFSYCGGPRTAAQCALSCGKGYTGSPWAKCPRWQVFPFGTNALSVPIYGQWQVGGCTNVNECLQKLCSVNATCTDTLGSFFCTCNGLWVNDPVLQGVGASGCVRAPCLQELPRGPVYGSQCNGLVPDGPSCTLYCAPGYGDNNHGLGVSYSCPGAVLRPALAGGLNCTLLSDNAALRDLGNLQYEELFMLAKTSLLFQGPQLVLGDIDGNGVDEVFLTYSNLLAADTSAYVYILADETRLFRRLSVYKLHGPPLVAENALWGVTERAGLFVPVRWGWPPPPEAESWEGEDLLVPAVKPLGLNCTLTLGPRLAAGELLFTLTDCPGGARWFPSGQSQLTELGLYAWNGLDAFGRGALLPAADYRLRWGGALWDQGLYGFGLLDQCDKAYWLEPTRAFGFRALWNPPAGRVARCLAIPGARSALAVTTTNSLLLISTTEAPQSGTYTVDEIATDVSQVYYCSPSTRPNLRLVVLNTGGENARVLSQNPLKERAAFDITATLALPGAAPSVFMRIACLKLRQGVEAEDYNLLVARLLQDPATLGNQSSFMLRIPTSQLAGGSALRLLDRCAFVRCAANASCELLDTWPRCRCAPGYVGDGANFCVARPELSAGGALHVLGLEQRGVLASGERRVLGPRTLWRCLLDAGLDPLTWCTTTESCRTQPGRPVRQLAPRAPHYYVQCTAVSRLEFWYNVTAENECLYHVNSAGWPLVQRAGAEPLTLQAGPEVWPLLGRPDDDGSEPEQALEVPAGDERGAQLCGKVRPLLTSFSCAFPYVQSAADAATFCVPLPQVSVPCGPGGGLLACEAAAEAGTYRCRANSSAYFVLDAVVPARALGGGCDGLRPLLAHGRDFNCSWPLEPGTGADFCRVVSQEGWWRLSCPDGRDAWCGPGACRPCAPGIDAQLVDAHARARASPSYRAGFWAGNASGALAANYPWLQYALGLEPAVVDVLCQQCAPAAQPAALGLAATVRLDNCPYACGGAVCEGCELLWQGLACSYHQLQCARERTPDLYQCWSLTDRLAWLAHDVPAPVVAAALAGDCRQLLQLQPSEMQVCRPPQRLDAEWSAPAWVGGCVFLVDDAARYAAPGSEPAYCAAYAPQPALVQNLTTLACGGGPPVCALTLPQGYNESAVGASCGAGCRFLLPAGAAQVDCRLLVRYCSQALPQHVYQQLGAGWPRLANPFCSAPLPAQAPFVCPAGRNVSCGDTVCQAGLPAFEDTPDWWGCAAAHPWTEPLRWALGCAPGGWGVQCEARGGAHACQATGGRWRLANCTVAWVHVLDAGGCAAVLAACPPGLPHAAPVSGPPASDGTVEWTPDGWRWSWPAVARVLAGRALSYCEPQPGDDVTDPPQPPDCAPRPGPPREWELVRYCGELPVHCWLQDFGRALQCANECELSGQCRDGNLPELRGGAWWIQSWQPQAPADVRGCWVGTGTTAPGVNGSDDDGAPAELCSLVQASCVPYCAVDATGAAPPAGLGPRRWSEADCALALFHEQRFRCGATDLVCESLGGTTLALLPTALLESLRLDAQLNDRGLEDYLYCHNAAPSGQAWVQCPVWRRSLGLSGDRCGSLARACSSTGGSITCANGFVRDDIAEPFCTTPELQGGERWPLGHVNCDCGVHWSPVAQALAPSALSDVQCYYKADALNGLSAEGIAALAACANASAGVVPPGLDCAARGLVSPDELVLLRLAADLPALYERGLLLEHVLRGTDPRASLPALPVSVGWWLRRLWAGGGASDGVALDTLAVLSEPRERRSWCLGDDGAGAVVPVCALRAGTGLPLCTVHCPPGTTASRPLAGGPVRCCRPDAGGCCWLGPTGAFSYTAGGGLARGAGGAGAQCRPNLFAERTAYARTLRWSAELAPSDADRQLCYEEPRCQGVVGWSNGGVFFSDRELNFPVVALRRYDPGRSHELEEDKQGTRYLHPVPERELEARGDVLVTTLQAATLALDRRVNQDCDRWLHWAWENGPARPAARLRAQLVLRENWRALARAAGLPELGSAGELAAANVLCASTNESDWRLRACPAANDSACLAGLDAWLPAAATSPLAGFGPLRLALGYFLQLWNLTAADASPQAWVLKTLSSTWFSAKEHAGVSQAQFSLVQRSLLRVDLGAEALRDALVLRDVFTARRARARPCFERGGCDEEWGLPCEGACARPGAWPGASLLLAEAAQAAADTRARRRAGSARFRPGDGAVAVAEARAHTLLRYGAPVWDVGNNEWPAGDEEGECKYDAPLPDAANDSIAVRLWGHDEVPGVRGELCRALVPTWPWLWAAYWRWRGWVLLDAFSHGSERWSAQKGNCTSLTYQLWRNEPVRVGGVWRGCYRPRCPQPPPPGFDWYRGAAGSELSWRIPDTPTAPRDPQTVPCGWDRGLCGADGACVCHTGFHVYPNTDPALLVYDEQGEARVARVLQDDACDIDARAVCRARLGGTSADCSERGVCVADFRASGRAAACRCGSYVRTGELGKDCYLYPDRDPRGCLAQPDAGFARNNWTSPPYGHPASCNIPPAGCYHAGASGDCQRARGDRVERRDCFGCQMPRTSLLLPDSSTTGSCVWNASTERHQCGRCREGYFGTFCEYVTLPGGCYAPGTAGERSCVWNWYLGQYEEAERSSIPDDLLRTSSLFRQDGCAAPACTGHGVCAQPRAFPLEGHDFDRVPPLPQFTYRMDRFQLPAYVIHQRREQDFENAQRWAAGNQTCRCERGWGGAFCQTRVCDPPCHLSATCYDSQDGTEMRCLCAVDKRYRCLRPEGGGRCSCENFPTNDNNLSVPTATIVCGPSQSSALVQNLGPDSAQFPWACQCQNGRWPNDAGSCLNNKTQAISNKYGDPPLA